MEVCDGRGQLVDIQPGNSSREQPANGLAMVFVSDLGRVHVHRT